MNDRPHPPTEAELADMFRPEDRTDLDAACTFGLTVRAQQAQEAHVCGPVSVLGTETGTSASEGLSGSQGLTRDPWKFWTPSLDTLLNIRIATDDGTRHDLDDVARELGVEPDIRDHLPAHAEKGTRG